MPKIVCPEIAVRKWLEKFVVELNLCPFAKPVLRANTLSLKVVKGDVSGDIEHCLTAVARECEDLDNNPECETSLLILESGYSDFDDYLDVVALSESLLTDLGYDGIYQVASFHPQYVFEGNAPDDSENYTNRSPYPLIHLLRESSISHALATCDNPQDIPERNIETMRRLDGHALQERLAQCISCQGIALTRS